MQKSPTSFSNEKAPTHETPKVDQVDSEHQNSAENQSTQDVPDDDFGDFQTA